LADNLDRDRLSQRENEILELAIEGLTDQQIAHRLEISASTVNSYWVRIRGKLGQVSRTELVATVLRRQAEQEMAKLRAESRQLVQLAEQRSRAPHDLDDAPFHHLILDALPDAVLAVDHRGMIAYVNDAFVEMLGYAASELLGQPVEMLLPPRDRERCRSKIAEYVACPYPLRLGVGEVIYGRRKDGHLLCLILAMDGRPTPRGPITTCVVRNFMDEIVCAQRHAAAIGEALIETR
jgi:PAS domain S-box-containing protein